jgi:membrane protease YdiL (CAAX protease family)
MAQERSNKRAVALLIAGLFATLFVLINDLSSLFSALIYIVLAVVSIFLYGKWNSFGRKGRLVGIDSNYVSDFLVGIGLGVGTIILGSIVPFIGALGIPNVQSISGVIGRFVIIVISAPIFEEILFRDFILDFFDEKLGNLPFIFANLIQATLFSLYHLTAYGQSLSAVSGSFITAGLMGFAFGYVRLYQKSVAGAIAYHMTLNAFIGFIKLAVIIAVGGALII